MAAAPSFRLAFGDSKLTGGSALSTCVRQPHPKFFARGKLCRTERKLLECSPSGMKVRDSIVPPAFTLRPPAWVKKAFSDVPEMIQHTTALICAAISIWIVHYVFSFLVGSSAKFFDWIPIRWVFDAAHLA